MKIDKAFVVTIKFISFFVPKRDMRYDMAARRMPAIRVFKSHKFLFLLLPIDSDKQQLEAFRVIGFFFVFLTDLRSANAAYKF